MSESITIARQYAQAVFEIAKESDSLAAWAARLSRLAMISEDAGIAAILGNPTLSNKQISDALFSIAGEPGNRELASFISVLMEHGRFGIVKQVSEIFGQIKDEDDGVKEAVIYSAFPIEAPQLEGLLKQCRSHFDCELRPRVEIDPSLIGGAKIVVGDRALDLSVRGKLDAMNAALKKN